jgi:subtilase family serine protease
MALSGICAVAVLLFSPTADAAGQRKSFAIRGDRAFLLAQPSATAHFGCELRAFAGTRLFCYGPAAIRSAYGVDSLISHGTDGRGQTIVIIDTYGSPTVQADLSGFDATFGLPNPNLTVVPMPGLAPFDDTDPNQLGWAEETSLDVQWSHAIAPGAHIVLIEAATNNDPDLLVAQDYAIKHYPGAIISESYGESEYDLATDPTGQGQQILANDEASYARARAAGNTVFVSAGDSGAADPDTDPVTGLPVNAGPIAAYPASSPNVTSVGGTNLFFGTAGAADPNGSYLTESVWNDGYGAGGGGISGVFPVPDWQTSNLPAATLAVTNGFRAYPDVSYNAGVVGGVLVQLGFLGSSSGTYIFGGTSAGAPQWSGIAALSSQIKGSPLGFINTKLYRLGALGPLFSRVRDVTAGQNGFNTTQGYPATPAWDISSGWGTPNLGLVRALGSN